MFYSASPLNRLDHLRSDNSAIDALWNSSSTRVVPIWRNQVLVEYVDKSPIAVTIETPETLPDGTHKTLLGTSAAGSGTRGGERDGDTAGDKDGNNNRHTGENVPEIAWFSIDYSALEQDQITGIPNHAEFVDLRIAGPGLPDDEAAILAYSRALSFWQSNSGFCSNCGQPNLLVNAGHVQRCSNQECSRDEFPRTDPAVIMLVTNNDPDDPKCLLGRSVAWPQGVYSTLAGFVEPGETLEGAVVREVKEESNIDVTDVQYVASQPWPFPRSIMLGFRATANSFSLQIDPAELDDAQWFTRAELLTFGVWGEDSDNLKLPRPDSIARFLIDSWIKDTSK